MYTWSVQKVSKILNFRELRIFDLLFFCGVMSVLICLTYTDKFGHFECSVNFWQLFSLDVFWLTFDFCLFSFGNKKKSQGARSGEYGGCGNIIVLFLAKIRAQATMCEQGRYHGAKANFCSSTNPGVSGGLLRANCAYLSGNIPHWPFHPEILIQFLWSIFWNRQKSTTSLNTSKQNSCQKLTEHSKWPNLSP